LLTHETIYWAKHFNQPLVFLKLNFIKAYDKMGWDFMFLAFKKLGMACEFIGSVWLMFDKVEAVVCFNKRNINPFFIKKKVR
jgi:hypothetical protein